MPRTVRRWMTHLALLAIVLLATVPTVGRVLSGATPASQPLPSVRAMHRMPVVSRDTAEAEKEHAGHAAMMHSMHHMPAGMPMTPSTTPLTQHGPPGDQHRGHGEGDCDYCPLLHSLLAAPGVALLAIDEAVLPAPQVRMRAAALPWRYPSGLGSRGPPRTL